MTHSPSVGVIIPTHRFDKWLDESVQSTLASKNISIQVAVIANGLKSIAPTPWADDPRVTLVHEREPLGSGGAMLPGLDILKTEYIARLDADDRMHPDRLRIQAEYLDAHPDTPLVTSRARRIDGSGVPSGSVRAPIGDDVRRHLVLSNTLVHSSYMVRRSSLDLAGGYDPSHKQMDDYDLVLRLAQLGPIATLGQELVDYRIHSGQVSKGAKPRGEHITRVIRLRRKLGHTLGMSPVEVWAKNAVWRTIQFTRYYGITKPGYEY